MRVSFNSKLKKLSFKLSNLDSMSFKSIRATLLKALRASVSISMNVGSSLSITFDSEKLGVFKGKNGLNVSNKRRLDIGEFDSTDSSSLS